MKKTLTFILCAVMLLSFAACSSGGGNSDPGEASAPPAEKPGDTLSLEEIMTEILDGVADLPNTENIALTEQNFESYLFTSYIDGSEALASEALITAIAHSTVLLRVPDGTDAKTVAEDIEANANPGKWICVQAEKTVVKVHGQTILLVMSFSSTADEIAANFDALWA